MIDDVSTADLVPRPLEPEPAPARPDAAAAPEPPRRRTRREALEILRDHPEIRQDQESYNINVTSNGGTRLSPAETFAEIAAHAGTGRPTHLYFHVPLCDYICKFCNYVKRLAPKNDGGAALDAWTALLVKESRLYLEACPWMPAADVQSLYLGGGTASLLRTRHLRQILEHVRAAYALNPDAEISLEGNPDNFLETEAADAVALGFNRFSLGVQSLQDLVTDFTGRKHDAAQSRLAIERLNATGKPFNVDMMFGLPHQTVESVADDMEELVALGVPTITIYRFRNAQRHEMGIGNKSAWNNSRKLDEMRKAQLFPSLERTYAMREAIVDVLLQAGYWPSPCGWWSRPGTYPAGNIPQVSRNKWQRFDTMIAYGPGAYGWLSGDRREVVQTHNIQDIAAYMRHMDDPENGALAFGRRLSQTETVGTVLGFAFKANQPIELGRFQETYGVDLLDDAPYREVLETLLDKGFLEFTADRTAVRPSLDGETVHEEIISHYMHTLIGASEAVACKR
jgi:oxygen-independent coproporphyrinogen-3 oxidase